MINYAQTSTELEEGKPKNINGIEYSYSIKNEREEETYSRFEVTVTAQNKSGCIIIYFKKEDDDLSSIFDGDPSAIAKFECINATGKRLTSKDVNIKAKAFKVPYKTTTGIKGTTEGGYLLKNNGRISSEIIIIVPKGERPKFKVRPQDFAELSE
jgi:hypothetical protein